MAVPASFTRAGSSPIVSAPDVTDEPTAQVPEAISERGLLRRFLSLRTLISFIVAAALLVVSWILAGLTFEDILDRISRADPWLIVVAYAVFGLTFPLRTLRWRVLLENAAHREERRPRYRNWWLLQILYISWFVNGILPLKLGDLYRAYMARANFATSLTRTLGTIFSERVLDVGALIVMVLASAAFIVRASDVSEDIGRVITITAAALAVLAPALALMLVFGRPVFRLVPARVQGIYDRFHSGTFDSWTWRTGPFLWLVSFVIWGLEVVRLGFVTRALGVEIGPAQIVLTGTAASLLLAVPTPGGLGAVEGGLLGLMHLVGVASSPAGAVAIVDRVITYWSVIVSGAVVFVVSRLKKQ